MSVITRRPVILAGTAASDDTAAAAAAEGGLARCGRRGALARCGALFRQRISSLLGHHWLSYSTANVFVVNSLIFVADACACVQVRVVQ